MKRVFQIIWGIALLFSVCIGIFVRLTVIQTPDIKCRKLSDTKQLTCSLLSVAEDSEFTVSADEIIADLKQRLHSAPNPDTGLYLELFTITLQDDAEFYNDSITYHAEITNMLQGNSAKAHDQITLWANSAFWRESEQEYLQDKAYAEKRGVEFNRECFAGYRSPMNILQAGHEYMVFAAVLKTEKKCAYLLSPLQYFDLTSDASVPVNASENPRYCDYAENEIFAYSQSYIDSYLKVKHAVIDCFSSEV